MILINLYEIILIKYFILFYFTLSQIYYYKINKDILIKINL